MGGSAEPLGMLGHKETVMIAVSKLMLLDYTVIAIFVFVLYATNSAGAMWPALKMRGRGIEWLAKIIAFVTIVFAWVFSLDEVWRVLVLVAVCALVYLTYLERKFLVLLAAMGINVVANVSMMIRELDILVLIAFKAGVYVAALVLLIHGLARRSAKEPNG